MTGFAPILWFVWGGLVVLLAALKVYSSRLSRDEDDQIILDDSFNHVKTEQAAIMARVHKIQPIEKTALWLVVGMTVVVVAYYIIDIFNQFK
jgi:hypothetical protein